MPRCPPSTATSPRAPGRSATETTAGPSLTAPLRASRQHWALQHWGGQQCSAGHRYTRGPRGARFQACDENRDCRRIVLQPNSYGALADLITTASKVLSCPKHDGRVVAYWMRIRVLSIPCMAASPQCWSCQHCSPLLAIAAVACLYASCAYCVIQGSNPISQERLEEAVRVIISYQNRDGGMATYENTRSFHWLEVRGYEQGWRGGVLCQGLAAGAIGTGIGATVRSLSCGGITDRPANPTHLGAVGTSVFGMGAHVPNQVISSLVPTSRLPSLVSHSPGVIWLVRTVVSTIDL